jgi:predicted transcriptional regulator
MFLTKKNVMQIRRLLLHLTLLIVLLSAINTIPTSSSNVTDDLNILVLYGSDSDYNIIKKIENKFEGNLTYFNASIPWNDNKLVDINQYKAIWIFYSLPIVPHLPEITSDWIEKDKGLFIMSSHLEKIQKAIDLRIFGIQGISQITYPIDDKHDTILNMTILPSENLINWPNNRTNIQMNGRTNLITIKNNLLPIISIEIPISNDKLNEIRSGVFVSNNIKEKVIIGTLSFTETATAQENIVKLNSVRKSFAFPVQITDLLTDLLVSLGEFSSIDAETPSNVFIIPELGDIFATFSIITIIIGFLTILIIKWKEISLTILVFIISLIAHISYVPSRRRLSRTDLLENDTRSKILSYIEGQPNGVHLREVQRNVGCGVSTLLWHLQTLEDFGLIESTKVGRYTIFLPIDNNLTTDRDSILPIQSEQAKKIWDLLNKKNKPLDLSTISKKTDCHIETARYHLKKFEESGYVNKIKDKKIFYFVPPRISEKTNPQKGHEL